MEAIDLIHKLSEVGDLSNIKLKIFRSKGRF
jgi:hypothetical protein